MLTLPPVAILKPSEVVMNRALRWSLLALSIVVLSSCGRQSGTATQSDESAVPSTVRLTAADMDALREKTGLVGLKEPADILDFELRDLQGARVKLSSFVGKVFLINFWATWCPPCRAEIPALQQVYEKLGKLGFEVVAIDVMEDPDTVSPFVKQYKMGFQVLLDSDGKAGAAYGASAIPTTYVVDRKGRAVAGVQGALEWNTPEMEQYFRALLAEQ